MCDAVIFGGVCVLWAVALSWAAVAGRREAERWGREWERRRVSRVRFCNESTNTERAKQWIER